MSLSKRTTAICVLWAVTLLGACGFEPLHRATTASSGLALSNVEIARIPDRSGQMLRNELLSLVAPRGHAANPAYRLDVTVTESTREVLLEETSFSTRADLTVTASAQLVRVADGVVVDAGSVKAVSGYNILSVTQEYANVVSERNAREGALRLVARDLVRQVSVWLRNAESGVAAQ